MQSQTAHATRKESAVNSMPNYRVGCCTSLSWATQMSTNQSCPLTMPLVGGPSRSFWRFQFDPIFALTAVLTTTGGQRASLTGVGNGHGWANLVLNFLAISGKPKHLCRFFQCPVKINPMAQQMQTKPRLLRVSFTFMYVTEAQIRCSSCTYEHVQMLVQHNSNKPKTPTLNETCAGNVFNWSFGEACYLFWSLPSVC